MAPAAEDELGDVDARQLTALDDLLLTDGHSELATQCRRAGRRVDLACVHAEEGEGTRVVARQVPVAARFGHGATDNPVAASRANDLRDAREPRVSFRSREDRRDQGGGED